MYVVIQKDNANAGKTHQKKTRFGYLFDKGAEVVKQVSKDKICFSHQMNFTGLVSKYIWTRTSEEMDGTLPRIASFENT